MITRLEVSRKDFKSQQDYNTFVERRRDAEKAERIFYYRELDEKIMICMIA